LEVSTFGCFGCPKKNFVAYIKRLLSVKKVQPTISSKKGLQRKSEKRYKMLDELTASEALSPVKKKAHF